MKVKLKAVRREEWLKLLTKAEKNVGEDDKHKWQNLRLGADRAKGHIEIVVQAEHYELIEKAANAKVQGPAKP